MVLASSAQFGQPKAQVIYFKQSIGSAPAESSVYALDLAQCQADDCPLVPVTTLPLWSPDQAWVLVTDIVNQTISLGDATGQVVAPIGPGFAPFWLDMPNFGYLRPLSPETDNELPATELVISSTDAPAQARVSLTVETLQEFLRTEYAEDLPVSDLFIAYVSVIPGSPERVYILGIVPQGEQLLGVWVFELDVATDKVLRVLELPSPLILDLVFTRGGRYLVVSDPTHLNLYRLETGELIQYPQVASAGFKAHAWSDDETWLLILAGDQVTLAAPDHDYSESFSLAGRLCVAGAWVRR